MFTVFRGGQSGAWRVTRFAPVKGAALSLATEMPPDIRVGFIANKWGRAEAVTPEARAA